MAELFKTAAICYVIVAFAMCCVMATTIGSCFSTCARAGTDFTRFVGQSADGTYNPNNYPRPSTPTATSLPEPEVSISPSLGTTQPEPHRRRRHHHRNRSAEGEPAAE